MSLAVASRLVPRPFVVHRNIPETADTFTLFLRPPVGSGAHFAPGQFNMLYTFGIGEVPISMSGDPAEAGLLVHTIRAVGPVTRALQRLKQGAVVGVRGPYGSAWPLEEAVGQDILIVAGGIGLAPLRSAIYRLFAKRQQFGELRILYGARSPADLLFAQELADWGNQNNAIVESTVDRATAGWRGNVGLVTQLIAHASLDPHRTLAMICGPEIMIRYAVQSLRQRNLPFGKIYVSMERNMKCAVGSCGRCQYGGNFVCRDGPVFRFDRIASLFSIREL